MENKEAIVTTMLANDRTLLASVRTAFAVFGFGILILNQTGKSKKYLVTILVLLVIFQIVASLIYYIYHTYILKKMNEEAYAEAKWYIWSEIFYVLCILIISIIFGVILIK